MLYLRCSFAHSEVLLYWSLSGMTTMIVSRDIVSVLGFLSSWYPLYGYYLGIDLPPVKATGWCVRGHE